MALTEIQLERYADVLLWGLRTSRREKYKKNDIILIRFDPPAIKLAEILNRQILDMGKNPVLRIGLTAKMERDFFEKGNNKQLVFLAPGEKELCEQLNGSIYLYAPESLIHLSEIDPKKIGKTLVARKVLRDILTKREEMGKYGWTLCTLPTPELARQSGLTLRQYSAQVTKACYLDKGDPVEQWETIFKDAMAIKRWLNSMEVKEYHIQSKNIDLLVTPGRQRKWIGISGHNVPSFELFLSPDWRGTEGIYYADQPSFRSGNYVKDIWLEFTKGSATKIEAEEGEDFLIK